ncbi:MAG: Pyridoxine kinase [Candidatus Ordinivivax streblomastigis]|uniref:pyridoxal kinase n=1 Tax=Candidatus Ordinivivax streblomastigis TaxID=2540710 RepID=A0A5M8P090_9BACT|nr:MAG: Pyridoxine kinase [Candidatus Ordinivivax streblomastigis]
MKRLKRVVAIHDISGFGKCSLTVALPIISAAGIETTVLPTAVLSTHTGGFTGFIYRDLTEDIALIAQHWKSLDIQFDAIYTGFLGSFEQLDLVTRFFENFKTQDNLILVDPVMADNGELYKIFPQEFPAGMRKLCAKADIIVPNLTEAALLLGESYHPGPYTKEYIAGILQKLSAIGPKKVVLTGVFFNEDELGAAAYDAVTGEISYTFEKRVPGYYHGTGDVFGSALLSALLNDVDLKEAAAVAVRFTTSAIRKTAAAGTDLRFGVHFEQSLPELLRELKLV